MFALWFCCLVEDTGRSNVNEETNIIYGNMSFKGITFYTIDMYMDY